jgi:large subunit ribosomal protein L7/L12
MAAPAAGGAAAAPKVEEKTTVDVVLIKVADTTKKIAVIKIVRELTGLGLKEAKDVVDKAPQVVKAGALREDAQAMKEKLEKEGATIELK